MQFFGPKPPFFWVVRTRLNGIISPPYPEATLDNFGFPVGGRLAARRAVFRPPGRNLAISGQKTVFLDPKRATLGNRGHETACQTPKDHLPENQSLAARWTVFWPPGWILAILGQCPIAIISTLNFGPWSMKLGGTVWATKKMTHIDNGPGLSWNYGETAVFTFC